MHVFFLRVDPKWSATLREDPRFEAQLERCAFSRHQSRRRQDGA